jgi:hypothetical protein
MAIESLLALAVVLGLLSAAAWARRSFAAGWQRNALSVIIVVLSMVAAFMLFFGLGAAMRWQRSPAQVHGHSVDVQAAISLALDTRLPLPVAASFTSTE